MTERRKIGMVSQLILRNAEQLRTGQVLLINPPRDSCCSRLSQDQRQVSVFSQDFADYNYLNSRGVKAEFGLIPSVASTAQDIVLVLPRERERLEMLLHALSSSMPPQSILWLAGENRSWIKSSGQRLRAYFRRFLRSTAPGIAHYSDPVRPPQHIHLTWNATEKPGR